MLVTFRNQELEVVNGDSQSFHLQFNMNFFNNDAPRKQVKGYLDVFDQFKVLTFSHVYRMKEPETIAKPDVAVPIMYTSYDHDCQGRDVDMANMLCLQNMRKRVFTPFKTIKLSLRPIWDMAPTKYGDVETGVRKVDNPWFDTALLTNAAGERAPGMRSQNVHLGVLEHALGRQMTVLATCRVLFRGRRNGLTYKSG